MNMYQVIDTHDNSVVATGFERKEGKRKNDRFAAKVKRDKLNKETPNRYILGRGTYHPKGQSNGVSTRNRGKNSRF